MKNLFVLGVAGCIAGFAAFTASAQAEVFMPGHEVAQIVVGNTIEGQYRECGAARNDFIEYYAPDGKISGKERACNQVGDWTNYGGVWSVTDGKFCVTLGSGRSNGCFDYEVDEDSTLSRVGEPGVGNTKFKIYDGNPQGL